ncbi:MAG TPA: isoleucine--tRNA ligase [Candidatus Onthovicinus excrementipullorum]|nr:isoleucine--tRNA ligase [Candidatus Onthovicinus excrementipullorum]
MADKNEFIAMEHEVMKFWEENDCFGKLKAKNAGHERFRFIDGPITANNPMGVHHAWGRTLKDTFLRYNAMKGKDCRYQNGFDSQGLWVEVEVEKELGFKTKKDIEAYGMDQFTHKCVDRVKHFSSVITEQSKRLGQWMDWDNSYFTNTDKNITSIWYFLKKCHENGWIEREYKPMPWCPRCGTSLSEHEMTGSYKMLKHNSVFFKLPVKELGCNILVWTTTPWTLSSNVALAVNEDIDYVEVTLHSDDKHLILAKNAIKYLGDDKKEVLRAFKGKELEGMHFETCFPDFEAQKDIDHRIVLWDQVDAEEGTGVVHIAPGCGAEDFELGESLGLAKVMPVDDMGIFLEGFGWMTGKDSHTVAPEVFEHLEQAGKMYKVMEIEHSYPVCWRCKSEVIFRLVPAWYIRTDELRPRLIKAAESVKWEPAFNGKRMVDWLNNMGDWNISRKRYYGLPLPFYPCPECGHLTVVGSREELRELGGEAVDKLPELHRPWIDDIKITCPHCGAKVSRVQEIGDVWLDAGIVPFSTTGYFDDKEEWKKNYPAEWITEMREQVRLWFYSMLFMSVVLEDRAPYERVLSYNSVVAEDGSKFSKTGFMIKFDEAAEKIGADSIRYLYAGAPVANDVRFGFNLGDEARRKLLAFYNIYTFFNTYAAIDKPDLTDYQPDDKALKPVDRFLILRTNEFIRRATDYMDAYKAYQLVKEFEAFVDDISNWYIRLNRRRFWKSDNGPDKMAAYWTLFNALNACVRCMAPIIPFMTEHIWQELTRKVLRNAELSVHLSDWPKPIEGIHDDGVLESTALSRDIIATAMRLRNEAQIKVRQPLSVLYVCCTPEQAGKIAVFEQSVLDELNIKAIKYIEDKSVFEDAYLAVNFKVAGAVLKQNVNKMKQSLAELDADAMAALVAQFDQGGKVQVPGWEEAYDASIFQRQTATKQGIVSAECSAEMVIAIDTTITEDLKKEGAVRDIIRQCQILRKDAGYQVEQHVAVSIVTADSFLGGALKDDEAHIASELLADSLSFETLADADLARDIDTEYGSVAVAVKKA